MLTTFIDKLSGFLSQRFMIAFWAPAFTGLCLFGALVVARLGLAELTLWWDGRSPTQQILLGFAVLLVVTVLAYLLQALTVPVVRLYEGYWSRPFGWLRRWGEAAEERRHRSLRERYDSATGRGAHAQLAEQLQWRDIYYSYPHNKKFIRATRFGNTMTAAEEYAYYTYRADAIIIDPLAAGDALAQRDLVDIAPLQTDRLLLSLPSSSTLDAAPGAPLLFTNPVSETTGVSATPSAIQVYLVANNGDAAIVVTAPASATQILAALHEERPFTLLRAVE